MKRENKDILLIDCMHEIPNPKAPYNQRNKFRDKIMIAVTAVFAGIEYMERVCRPYQGLRKR